MQKRRLAKGRANPKSNGRLRREKAKEEVVEAQEKELRALALERERGKLKKMTRNQRGKQMIL